MQSQIHVLMRIPEVATRLDISETSVRRLIAAGRLPKVQAGLRVVRIPREAVEAILNGDNEGHNEVPVDDT